MRTKHILFDFYMFCDAISKCLHNLNATMATRETQNGTYSFEDTGNCLLSHSYANFMQ